MEKLIHNSLTKENFWNDLYKRYPGEVQKFCDWIDEYKKQNNWTDLFNEVQSEYPALRTKAPKFHDLPIAMQIGIFLQFIAETDKAYELELPTIESIEDINKIPELIKEWFFYEDLEAQYGNDPVDENGIPDDYPII